MANTKGRGLVLEVGTPVTLTDTGYVVEEQAIYGLEQTPIYGDIIVDYEQVETGGESVLTGYNTIINPVDGLSQWEGGAITYIEQGSFNPSDPVNALYNAGDTYNFMETYGPSMCGDYKMYNHSGKNNCSLALNTTATNTNMYKDSDESDQFTGLDICGVKTFGNHNFNFSNVTETGGSYDFMFDQPSGGALPWDFDNQIVEFTCRQFGSSESWGYGSRRRKCEFATFNEGENGLEGVMTYNQGNSQSSYTAIVRQNGIAHGNGQTAGLQPDSTNFQGVDSVYSVSVTNGTAVSGHQSVQGRTLYLFPRNWVAKQEMYDKLNGASATNNTEWVDNPIAGEYATQGGVTNATMRWSQAPYNGVLTFDILDGFGDKLYCKGTGNQNILEWIQSLPTFAWPDGLPQTVETFFSFYHGVVSHWLHSDGFIPNTIWNGGYQSNMESGLWFRSDYVKNPFEPEAHIGSICNEYNGYDVFPTYRKRGYLGWRSVTSQGDSSLSWSEDMGFNIYVKASSFSNCKIEILTDTFSEADKTMLSNNFFNPGEGAMVDTTGNPPYVLHTLTENNVETSNSVLNEQGDLLNTKNYIFGPRAYCDSIYNNSSGAATTMRATVRANYGTGDDDTYEEYFIDRKYGGLTPLAHWEWLRVVPIDKTQPYSVMIEEVRVSPAVVNQLIVEEPIYQWVPEYTNTPIYGWGETGEFTETEVITGYENITLDEWDIVNEKNKWEYLDILKADNPVALTFNSGDLKDIKKRTAGFSKTFDLPHNKHNQRVLNVISGNTSDRPKQSIQWRPARIKSNGIIVFKGFARIETSTSGRGGKYSCHIIEDPTWWPNLIGERKLCDLVLPIHYKTVDANYETTDYDPVLGEDVTTQWPTIMQTWDKTPFEDGGGVYNPDGDYNSETIPGTGLGYVYPLISYGNWNNMIDEVGYKSAKDFHPAYYVKYLVEEIFKSINYKISSNFFNSEAFKRLIIPYTSGEDYNNADDMLGSTGSLYCKAKTLEKNFWNNVSCDANNQEYEDEIDTHNSNRNGVYLPRLSAVTDESGLWVGSPANTNGCTPQGGYQVPFTGRYRLRFSAAVRWSDTCGNGKHLRAKWLIYRPSYSANWRIVHKNYGSDNHTVSYNSNRFSSNLQSSINNGSITNDSDSEFDFEFEYVDGVPMGHTIAWDEEYASTNPYGCGNCDICDCQGATSPIEDDMCGSGYDDGQCWHTRDMECIMKLEQGDIINVGYFAHNTSSNTFGCHMYMDVKNQEFQIFPEPGSDDAPPSVVSPNKVLGCKTKQLDLIKGLTELFNLHWTADAELKTISVEPYDDFYGTGKILDWTSKLDHTSWTDKFIIDDMAKLVKYRYKTDTTDRPIVQWEDENEPQTWLGKIIEEGDLYRKEVIDRGTTVFHSTMTINDRTVHPSNWMDGVGSYIPCMWNGQDEDWLHWVEMDNDEDWMSGSYDLDAMMLTPRPERSYSFGIRILNYYGRIANPANEFGHIHLMVNGDDEFFRLPYADTREKYKEEADQFSLDWDNHTNQYGNTSPGLYQKYWKNLHDKINGGVALRTCKMNLKDADVSDFDYRDIIKLKMDGVCTYWTLNKIIDYKPGGDELTKVELVEFDMPPKIRANDENYTRKSVGLPEVSNYNQPIKEKGTYTPTVKKNRNKKSKSNIRLKENRKGQMSVTLKNKTGNKSFGTGIAIGHGVNAGDGQTVIGKYNADNKSDMVQIGGGYIDSSGKVVKKNALTVNSYGDITFYGGNVVAEFTTGDLTMVGDVYFVDRDGKTKKLYI